MSTNKNIQQHKKRKKKLKSNLVNKELNIFIFSNISTFNYGLVDTVN